MSNIEIKDYTAKSIVVRGEDTRSYTDQFKELGGKWNRNLKGGSGWIFSKKRESDVRKILGFSLKEDGSDEEEEEEEEEEAEVDEEAEVKESKSSKLSEPQLKLPADCQKYAKNTKPGTIDKIEKFCELLTANKVKDGKEALLDLPYVVQCLFLHYAWEILSHKAKYSAESYMVAFLLFKLFRGKDMKGKEIYKRYLRLKTVETYYKKASEFKKKSPGLVRKAPTTSSRARKKYDKEFQRAVEPTGPLDPLYLFYTSLYEQNSKSPLAITWLTEHGVFDGNVRQELVKKYQKLAVAKMLIK